MAAKTDKGKKAKAKEKGAGAQAGEGGAQAQLEKGSRAAPMLPEKGVCIICGEARSGTPAEPELPIRAARKLRALLRIPQKHTVACGAHLAEARSKRAKYGKKVRDYALGAALFFLFVVAGSFIFKRGDLGLFVPALLGAFIIALLPHFYYFPPFGK